MFSWQKSVRQLLGNVSLEIIHSSLFSPKLALSDIHSQADEMLLNKTDTQQAPDTGTLRSEEVYKSTVTRENNRAQQWYVLNTLEN